MEAVVVVMIDLAVAVAKGVVAFGLRRRRVFAGRRIGSTHAAALEMDRMIALRYQHAGLEGIDSNFDPADTVRFYCIALTSGNTTSSFVLPDTSMTSSWRHDIDMFENITYTRVTSNSFALSRVISIATPSRPFMPSSDDDEMGLYKAIEYKGDRMTTESPLDVSQDIGNRRGNRPRTALTRLAEK